MNMESIQSLTGYFLTQKSETYSKIFLIHRSGHKDISKKFHAHVAEIDDDLKPDFDAMTKQVLQDIQKNYSKIKSFNDPENTDEYRIMKKDTISELDGLFEELETQKDLSPITNFDQMERDNHNMYCLQFKTPDKRIFMFAKIEKYVVLKNIQNIIAEFKSKKLAKKKNDVVIFSKNVFCVYYENIEKLLMLKYSDTKKLLGFKKLFKDNCTKILRDDLEGVIRFEEKNLDSILGNNDINEFLLKMNNRNLIETNHLHYEKWNELYEKQKFIDKRLSKLMLDPDGVPIVKNSRELGMVLYVSNNDIMTGVIKRGEYALVLSKVILK